MEFVRTGRVFLFDLITIIMFMWFVFLCMLLT